jgi:hypothetical protein
MRLEQKFSSGSSLHNIWLSLSSPMFLSVFPINSVDSQLGDGSVPGLIANFGLRPFFDTRIITHSLTASATL